jgi:protein gp37
MAENSKIEWTDHTFNPWIGCTKVSDGCKHCYAETLMDHRYKKVTWGPEGTRVRTSAANWKKPLQWNRQAQAEGRRYRVFCASLADVFEDRPELVEWRRDLLGMIEQTPNLDWLLLTKRPENVNQMIAEAIKTDAGDHGVRVWLSRISNVWIGTSVENQQTADERIPHLLQIPAAVRFLSMEPLLGPVNLPCDLIAWGCHDCGEEKDPVSVDGGWRCRVCLSDRIVPAHPWLDWVIVGGESGHGARPMHPHWAQSIRDQCVAAGVAFHFKQWGEWLPMLGSNAYRASLRTDGRYLVHFEDGTTATGEHRYLDANGTEPVYRVGKRAAGRLLDGRTWDEFPAVAS